MKYPFAPIFTAVFLLALLSSGLPVAAAPYKAQAPKAELGKVKISLNGPPSFVRIDGLDQNLDDILLATQSPAAAVLAIYADPEAWKNFNSQVSHNDRAGLNCHALISTPAPMAGQIISVEEFDRIKKDLHQNLKNVVGRERRLESELAGVTDHQVESAKGLMESFEILEETPTFTTYRLTSSLELKLKDLKQLRRNRSVTLNTTVLLSGKIINLQLVVDDPEGRVPAKLEETARLWRDEFLNKNSTQK